GLLCGDVSPCGGQGRKVAPNVGASYWFTRFLAADVGFMKPANVNGNGSGTNYRFTSALDTRILTLGAKVGGQAGPLRIYGMGGGTYHQGLSSTTETIDPTDTTRGGTQTIAVKTTGWGLVGGAGIETWLVRSILGFYAEGGRMLVRGKEIN